MLKYIKHKAVWYCTECKKEFETKKEIVRHFILAHAKVRKTWTRKPQTQIKQSGKKYNRKKSKQKYTQEDLNV